MLDFLFGAVVNVDPVKLSDDGSQKFPGVVHHLRRQK
jgi:hypothetical protein